MLSSAVITVNTVKIKICFFFSSTIKPTNSLRKALGKKYHFVFAEIPRMFFNPTFFART